MEKPNIKFEIYPKRNIDIKNYQKLPINDIKFLILMMEINDNLSSEVLIDKKTKEIVLYYEFSSKFFSRVYCPIDYSGFIKDRKKEWLLFSKKTDTYTRIFYIYDLNNNYLFGFYCDDVATFSLLNRLYTLKDLKKFKMRCLLEGVLI